VKPKPLKIRSVTIGGGKPAFKGYQVRDKIYQHTLCVSVNEEVVHGIPSRRVLKEGDIVGLDIGVVVDGYYGDAAITVPAGAVSPGMPVARCSNLAP